MNSHPSSPLRRTSNWLTRNHDELALAVWSTVSFYIMGSSLAGNSSLLFVPLVIGAVYFPVITRKRPMLSRVNPWVTTGALLLSFAILASYLFNSEFYDPVFICGNVISDVLLFITLYTITWKMEVDFKKLLFYQCLLSLPVFLLVREQSIVQWGRVIPANDAVSPNYVAMMGLVCVIAACGARSLIKMGLLAALPLYIIVVMQSRDSLLGCCIVAAIIFSYRLSQINLRKLQVYAALFFLLTPVVCLGLYVAGVDALGAAENLFEDVTMVNDEHRGLDSGGSGRTELWEMGIQYWAKQPVFGLGFKGQQRVLPNNLLAHNAYLGLLMETGVVGLMGYLIIVFTGLYWLLRRRGRLDSFPQRLAVYVSFLIYGLVESRAFGFGNTYTLLFLMIAFDSSKRQYIAKHAGWQAKSPRLPVGAAAPAPVEVSARN